MVLAPFQGMSLIIEFTFQTKTLIIT